VVFGIVDVVVDVELFEFDGVDVLVDETPDEPLPVEP
jgi:hypothetical protein